ncbi:MAG: hypothetical protein HGB22_08860 [Chlorobiaceae bacterium]|nr:hypothetical protein [Chlorobiaceae bacterium]
MKTGIIISIATAAIYGGVSFAANKVPDSKPALAGQGKTEAGDIGNTDAATLKRQQ